MNDCSQSPQVSAFIDGELSSHENARLSAHLEVCAACSRELEELRALRATLISLPSDTGAGQRILKELAGGTKSSVGLLDHIRVPRVLAASFLLLFGLSLLTNAYLLFRPARDGLSGIGTTAKHLGSRSPDNSLPPSAERLQTRESTTAERSEISPPVAPAHTKLKLRKKDAPAKRLNAGTLVSSAGPTQEASLRVELTVSSQDGQDPIYRIRSNSYRPSEPPIIRVGGILRPPSPQE